MEIFYILKGINLSDELRCADEDFIDNIGGKRLPQYCILHINVLMYTYA